MFQKALHKQLFLSLRSDVDQLQMDSSFVSAIYECLYLTCCLYLQSSECLQLSVMLQNVLFHFQLSMSQEIYIDFILQIM